MKLRDKLDRIRSAYPKGPTAYGQLYSGALPRKRWKSITLYTLFVSDERTHLLRPHIFETNHASRNAKQWAAWLAKNLADIHLKAVLPGIGVRTAKSWAVKQILGWSAGKADGTRGKRAKHKADNSAVAKRRNKTKSSGRKNGQIHIRRRHRNRKGKAK